MPVLVFFGFFVGRLAWVCVFMIIMTWNCQGACSSEFIRAAHLFINTHRPDVLALLETKVAGEKANEVCKQLGFSSWVRVEALGFSGGIWIIWNDKVNIRIRYTHPQFVALDVIQPVMEWSMVIVYASPDGVLRKRLWRDLSKDDLGLYKEWLAVGDFNSVLSSDEVSSPGNFNERRSKGIKEWIFSEGLLDPGFSGPTFTWTRGKDGQNFRGARLDRALCTPEWLDKFPHLKVKHLPALKSDHSPILL